jgi:hypothetical protein
MPASYHAQSTIASVPDELPLVRMRNRTQEFHAKLRPPNPGTHNSVAIAVNKNELSAGTTDAREEAGWAHCNKYGDRLTQSPPCPAATPHCHPRNCGVNSLNAVGHLRANGVDIDGRDLLTAVQWFNIDSAAETIVANDAATPLRSREYPKPFALPEIEQDRKARSIALI